MELFGVAIVVALIGITLAVLIRADAAGRDRRAHGKEARAALQKRTSSVCESFRQPSRHSQPPLRRQ